MPTIKDVAKEAGVAVGTVSRYLNGATIKKDNRDKVVMAIDKLNYKINPIAHCLKTSKTRTVAIIVSKLCLENISMIHSIESKLLEYGYLGITCSTEMSSEIEKYKIDFLIARKIDGIICLPVSTNPESYRYLSKPDIPVLFINSPDMYPSYDSVFCHFKSLNINAHIPQKEIGEIAAYTMLKRINGDFCDYPLYFEFPPMLYPTA